MNNPALIGDVLVVDTNVVSFLFKRDSRAELYRGYIEGRVSIIAAQTRAELEFWTLRHNWGVRRKDDLRAYLKNFLSDSVDEAVCLRWAQVMDGAVKQGRPISNADAWIAATALAYNVPLLTHNPKHFIPVLGLTVISEA